MSRLTRKFVAILMLLWFPLSAGSALAATVSMQMHDTCHDMNNVPTMQHQHAGDHHAATQHGHGVPCSVCGTCHLGCYAYLATSAQEPAALQFDGRLLTPYQVSFVSFTSAPLDPPPLARS